MNRRCFSYMVRLFLEACASVRFMKSIYCKFPNQAVCRSFLWKSFTPYFLLKILLLIVIFTMGFSSLPHLLVVLYLFKYMDIWLPLFLKSWLLKVCECLAMILQLIGIFSVNIKQKWCPVGCFTICCACASAFDKTKSIKFKRTMALTFIYLLH